MGISHDSMKPILLTFDVKKKEIDIRSDSSALSYSFHPFLFLGFNFCTIHMQAS